ncbi:MAG: 16S rRNA (adenine(1518)-N(6)/adenine(1519)-N(6))-dimethyltransferase RsmA [Acidobacteriota bacterium]
MRARRRFAQHFLEPSWVARLVDAVDPQPGDRFVEIGPGRGAITVPLALRAARLVAVEIDRDLASALEARRLPNLVVIAADIRSVDLPALAADALGATPESPIRIAGNLPYNLSSPILGRLLSASQTGVLRDATLMLQREVADRLAARPGTKEYGVLTVTTALRADVTRLLSLPPGAFRPPPRVNSSVVRLTFRPPPPEVSDPAGVEAVVRAVFMERRKTLANALKRLVRDPGVDIRGALRAAGIDPDRRPETLDLGEFARVAARFNTRSGDEPQPVL